MASFHLSQYQGAYDGWRQKNSSTRQSMDLAMLEVLRTQYPDHHVTVTLPTSCDLLGFASAGCALAKRVDTPLCHAVRFYKSPPSRLSKDEGQLTDEVTFGAYEYSYNNLDFLVFRLRFMEPFIGEQHFLFVLHASNPNEPCPATDALLVASGKWTKELHGEIFVWDDSRWHKSKELWRSVDGASWDDVVLDPEMKRNLVHDVQSFFDSRDTYNRLKVPWKRGIILHGVPGNGKTLSIKALINSLYKREVPVPALYVKSLDTCNGPKWSIQKIFSKARAMSPCLLIFEDIDTTVTDKTRSYFLNEVDGLDSNDGLLILGSTNNLDLLDAAITKRPSRFDRKYHFQLPSEPERTSYCQSWAAKFSESPDVDFPEALCPLIAKMTDKFSFAYLNELMVASFLLLVRGAGDDDLADAAASDDVKSSSSEGMVVVEKSDKATGEQSDKPSDTQAEKRLPLLDVPTHLKENVLLRIITKQAEILLREMDNSGNAAAGRRSVGGDCEIPMAPFAIRARFASDD